MNAKTLVRSVSSSPSAGPCTAVEVEPTLVGDPDPAQGGAGAAGELLPRHEVGVVLHLGDEDLVALTEVEPRVLGLARDGVREARRPRG